jgi:5'-nucleotidase
MPPTFELVICITSSALFDCSESHKIWDSDGFEAYSEYQRSQMTVQLQPGVGFPLVQSLLALNAVSNKHLIEVVLVSRKDNDSSERVRRSIAYYNLPITRMSFTGGTDVTRYLAAWQCDLFLSTEEDQVRTVLCGTVSEAFAGIAAALVCNIVAVPTCSGESRSNSNGTPLSSEATMTAAASVSCSPVPSVWPEGQVRIAFDGDGVLFSDEAERVFKTEGLERFYQFERDRGHIALPKGPMQAFALKLQKVRSSLSDENKWRVRTFLVTARSDIGNVRVFKTLKEWNLEMDETHCLGGLDKTPFLRSINPAIFFDDSSDNIDRAKVYVPSGHVVYGVNNIVPTNYLRNMTTLNDTKDLQDEIPSPQT